ncbi:MAG: class I SAM-dependent methyltransferase [Geminicoccaceae bacterium]
MQRSSTLDVAESETREDHALTDDAIPGPADIYDQTFVPALFGQWGPRISALARIRPGETVLDVACGTGALTLAAQHVGGAKGRVVGLAANPEMLAVARRKSQAIEWIDGTAAALPFPDEQFDAVVSQFGMMFFRDRIRALREMMRVAKPGGRLVVAVCGAVEDSPGYDTLARLLQRLFGDPVRDAFLSPSTLGDPDFLSVLCKGAGLADAHIERHEGEVRFSSIADLVSTERACVWTLGGLLDDAQFERLAREAETALSSFVGEDGQVTFAMPALVITEQKGG